MKQDLDIPEESVEYLQENWEWFIREVEQLDFSMLAQRRLGFCVLAEVEDRNGMGTSEAFTCGDVDCANCIFNARTLESWKGEDDE